MSNSQLGVSERKKKKKKKVNRNGRTFPKTNARNFPELKTRTFWSEKATKCPIPKHFM